MTKVTLRAYNRQIEGMIEASQLDEAIAHCQHILKAYPMDVETYKLLGKTFLEARRYADAADIFQRVLMVAPDDFVSHVGMSIIRDDEGKLDEAIWHMERAFEVQPSNTAIQSELKRLYGRRDGVEPPKIRLSRDALANMYSQGELFNQAIAEIKTVLAEDPNRADLQVMLARAYYRAGKKVEAAEMAALLLKKYPYCLDAVKILVDVLPNTPKNENTQIYRHRLNMLEPYSAFATGSVFNTSEVNEQAVILEKLDYMPGAIQTPAQPNWASSLGIKLEGEKNEESMPTWLNPTGEAQEPAGPKPEEKAEPTQQDESVPGWMQEAGWQNATDKSQAGAIEPAPEPSEDEIAPGIIPDWLQSMAPKDAETSKAIEEPAAEASKDNGGDIPDWLKAMGTIRPDETINAAGEAMDLQKAAEETDMPDWLKSPMTPANDEAKKAEEETPVEDRLPVPNAAEPAAESDIPEWLKTAAPAEEVEQKSEQEALEAGETVPSEALKDTGDETDIPDWLKPTAPPEEAPDMGATVPSETLRGPTSGVEAPDWLNSTGNVDEKPEKSAEELFELEETAPSATLQGPTEANDFPDWLKSDLPEEEIEPKNVEGAASAEPEALKADESDLPDWLKSTPPTEEELKARLEDELSVTKTMPTTSGKEPAGDEDLPEWLKNLGLNDEEESAKTENPISPGMEGLPELNFNSAEAESLPDWLKPEEPAQEKTAETAAEAPEANMEANPPTENTQGEEKAVAIGDTPEEQSPSTEGEALPDWLSSIANEDIDTGEVEPETKASEGNETSFPDWLTTLNADEKPLQKPAQESMPEENVVPAAQDAGFPNWLNSIPEPEKSADELADTKPHKAIRLDNPPAEFVGPTEEMKKPEEPQTVEPQPAMDAVIPPATETVTPAEAIPTAKVLFPEDEPFKPTGEPKPLDIGDDAMGWLESLAAKQGAKADELLTKPQERPAEMPDWLKQEETKVEAAPSDEAGTGTQLETQTTEPVAEETPMAEEETQVAAATPEPMQEPIIPAIEEPAVETENPAAKTPEEEKGTPVTIEDDTMAWLESLAANQGAKPEELLTKPEERTTETPEWIKQATDENALAQEAASEAEEKIAETENNQAEPAITSAVEAPDWLKDLETGSEEEPAKAEAEFKDWLTEEQKTSRTDVTETPAEERISSAAKAEEELPAWMEEPEETASDAERTIADEWVPVDEAAAKPQQAQAEQNLPAAETPAVEIPETEMAEEAKPVETQAQASTEEPPAPRPIIKGTGMLARIPEGHQDADNLAAAQAALENDKPDEAMQEYEKLIKRGRLLDEVIHDLREAIYRYPVDVNTWQSLGDAYMRANRLQDALDAYTKAEELLR